MRTEPKLVLVMWRQTIHEKKRKLVVCIDIKINIFPLLEASCMCKCKMPNLAGEM